LPFIEIVGSLLVGVKTWSTPSCFLTTHSAENKILSRRFQGKLGDLRHGIKGTTLQVATTCAPQMRKNRLQGSHRKCLSNWRRPTLSP
jgi:hypothetical protein